MLVANGGALPERIEADGDAVAAGAGRLVGSATTAAWAAALVAARGDLTARPAAAQASDRVFARNSWEASARWHEAVYRSVRRAR